MATGFLQIAGETAIFQYRVNSSFDVGTFLGNLPVSDSKHIHASQASGIPIAIHPGIYPTPDATVTLGEYIFGFEIRPGERTEKPLPTGSHLHLTLETRTVRNRSSTLENTVVGHGIHDGVNVMAIERFIECFHHGEGRSCLGFQLLLSHFVTSAVAGPAS